MKAMVYSSDGNTNFFDIVTEVLQEGTLGPYLFINCLDYVLWTSIDLIKENGFTIKQSRGRHYPTETMTDSDYTYDLRLLASTPAQAAKEVRTNSSVMFFYVLLHRHTSVGQAAKDSGCSLADLAGVMYNREWWLERITVLSVWLNDVDFFYYSLYAMAKQIVMYKFFTKSNF